MPSTALLSALLSSLDHIDPSTVCRVILVCDAIGCVTDAAPPNFKRSRVTSEHARAYETYICNVRALAATSVRPCEVLVLRTWHGCGLAVGAALEHVRTRFMMLVQHDQLFLRRVDVCGVLAAMAAHPERLLYVALPSRTTVRYGERIAERFGLQLSEWQLPELEAPLLPLLMWFDKPHVTWSRHLRERVYAASAPVPRALHPGEFVEDVLGRAQLADIKANGLGAHAKYGTWVIKAVDDLPVTYHLSGRKVQATSQEETDGEGASPSEFPGAVQVTALAAGSVAQGVVPTWSEHRASIHLSVPGLAHAASAPGVRTAAVSSAPARPTGRFRGVCHLCKAKGHSFRYCPLSLSDERAASVDGEDADPAAGPSPY